MRTYVIFLLFAFCAIARVNGICKSGVNACFVDPCLVNTCDNHPMATCKANYCGGCIAEFYEGHKKVECVNSGVNIG